MVICAVVGMHPLSSSTPVRRSSARLSVPADDNTDTGVCLSSSKPCRATRRSLKQGVADNSIVLVEGNKNVTSVAGSLIDELEYRRHLRNSAGKVSRMNGFMCDITEGTSLLSSRRRSSVSDEKPNVCKPDATEPAVNQAAPQRQKRGWPKGVPRRKQVDYSLSLYWCYFYTSLLCIVMLEIFLAFGSMCFI